jgi:hypothetical protein
MNKKGFPSENTTFDQALWKAIAVSKSIDWVYRSKACPNGQVWRDWLSAAQACSADVHLVNKEGASGVKTWELLN